MCGVFRLVIGIDEGPFGISPNFLFFSLFYKSPRGLFSFPPIFSPYQNMGMLFIQNLKLGLKERGNHLTIWDPLVCGNSFPNPLSRAIVKNIPGVFTSPRNFPF